MTNNSNVGMVPIKWLGLIYEYDSPATSFDLDPWTNKYMISSEL